MGITVQVRRVAGLVAASLLVVGGVSGCASSVDTKVACGKVLAVLNSISTEAMSKSGDVQAMKKVYDDGAVKIREAAKGSSIQADAEKSAAALETLGQQVSDLVKNPSVTPPQLDTKSLVDAGVALRNACM